MVDMAKKDYDEDLYWGIVNSIIHDKRVITHPHLRRVHPHHGFKLKKNDHEIIDECFLLEELKEAIKEAPEEAVLHHLEGRNDFATWVREIIGDRELSGDLELIRPSIEVDAKAKLVHVLDSKIKSLKSDSINLIFD
ncbi:MAG: hypothetical protein JW778_02490 [Candidatus Altiarchaeota archaeon]|nr:hypothetical protein [Candidatus Altiarchaeota archaeon]